MTTVGYGDLYPLTPTGQVMTGFFMIFCLIVTALPVAIIGANFTVYYEYSIKREEEKLRSRTEKQQESAEVTTVDFTEEEQQDDISDCIEL